MRKPKKETGLGSSVFFDEPQIDKVVDDTEKPTSTPKKEPTYKASLNLSSDTYTALTALKVHLRKQRGKNVSFAEIIDNAVIDYLQKEGLQIHA
jgi:hypothetical protein